MTKKLTISIIVLIIIVIAVMSFGRPKTDGPTPTATSTPTSKLPDGSIPPANPELLKNVTWVWEKTVMNDDTVVTPKKVDAFSITLDSNGKVTGKTDCNGFFGDYRIGTDGVITFGPLGSTKMFCEGSQESDFVGAISQVKNYSLDTSANQKLLLYFNSGLIILGKK